MADRITYQCLEWGDTVVRPSEPDLCPTCRNRNCLRPKQEVSEAEISDNAKRQTKTSSGGGVGWKKGAVVAIGSILLITSITNNPAPSLANLIGRVVGMAALVGGTVYYM